VSCVPLGDLATLNPSAPALDADEDAAFVPMASVSEHGRMEVSEFLTASELKPGYSYMQSGDVLVAKITPCYENNKIAIADIAPLHGFGSTEFHVIRVDRKRLG
jgi:type I restriction enzyme, S subunit